LARNHRGRRIIKKRSQNTAVPKLKKRKQKMGIKIRAGNEKRNEAQTLLPCICNKKQIIERLCNRGGGEKSHKKKPQKKFFLRTAQWKKRKKRSKQNKKGKKTKGGEKG